MNETPTVQNVDGKSIGETSSNKNSPKPIVQISIPKTIGNPLDADKVAQEKAVTNVAKSYEAIVDKIIGVLDGAGVRLLRKRARKVFDDKQQAIEFSEQVRLTEESRETAKIAASRIAARRVTNPEVMDWAAIVSVGADWMTGLTYCMAELKEIEKERLKNSYGGNRNTQPTKPENNGRAIAPVSGNG